MADKLSVVIVDDSRSALAQAVNALEAIDDVELVGTARDGASAIRLVAERQPDLVLMDIVMPGMDGLAALRLLNANHPQVKIAMLSSVAGAASRAEEAFRLGAVQVLGKPLDGDALRILCEQLLRGAISSDEGRP